MYQNSAATTPRLQPVEADADGLFPAIFVPGVSYKMVLKDENGVTIQTIDSVGGPLSEAQYGTGSVSTRALADGSVTDDKIAAGAVTRDKLSAEVRIALGFEEVADLLADTSLSYSTGDAIVSEGDIVNAGGFRYFVAASSATVIAELNPTGYHLATAGNVKLYVDRISDAGFNVRAFGALGDYDDDTDAFQRALWALKPGGGGTLYVPNGGYYIHTTLEPAPDCAGLRILGEGYRGTLVAYASSSAGDLFSWNSDLDHVICENFSAGNVGNADRLMVIATVRSTFRNMWFRPTVAVNTSLVAATTGLTTYDLAFEGCHFESVSQAELNSIGLDIPRGHSLVADNCMFSGIRNSIKLGSASEVLLGANITKCRFEMFSGTATDRPGATDCIAVDAINVAGFHMSGCNIELAADTHASSTGHRAVMLRQKARSGFSGGNYVIGHGIATGAIEVNHADAKWSAIGWEFDAINGYGIIASGGTTAQVYAPSGSSWATNGTTGVAA